MTRRIPVRLPVASVTTHDQCAWRNLPPSRKTMCVVTKRPSSAQMMAVAMIIAITLLVVAESQQLRGPSWLQTHRSLPPQCPCDKSDHAATAKRDDQQRGLGESDKTRHQLAKATNGDQTSIQESIQDGSFQHDDCCRRKDTFSPRPVKTEPRQRRKTTSSQISFNFHTNSHGPKPRQIIPAKERSSWRISSPHDDSQPPMPSSYISTKEQVRAPAWLWPPIWFPSTQSPAGTTCLPTTLPTGIQLSVDTDPTATAPMVAQIDSSRAPSSPSAAPDPETATNASPFGSPFTWLDPIVDSPSIIVPWLVPPDHDVKPDPTNCPPLSEIETTESPTCDPWQFDPHSTADPTCDETASQPVSWWDKSPTCGPLATTPVPEIAPLDIRPMDTFEPTLSPIKPDDTTSLPNELLIEMTVDPSPVPTLVSSGDSSTDPTASPTCSTNDSTDLPTLLPSAEPSLFPTILPVENPSGFPSTCPTPLPTVFPTELPSVSPSLRPTFDPTISPSVRPTQSPSQIPSAEPSIAPNITPSAHVTTVQPAVASNFQPSDITPEVRPTCDSPSATPIMTESKKPTSQTTPREFDESSCKIWAYNNCVAKENGENWDQPCKAESFVVPQESNRLSAVKPNPLEEMEQFIGTMSIEEQIRVRSSLVVIYQEILGQH